MYVKDLKRILANCNDDDEITFIFDTDDRLSYDRGYGLYEATQVNMNGKKINGKIALSNGNSFYLLKGDEPGIYGRDRQ